MRQIQPRERGFSTVEIMIAGGLVAFLAVALLPAAFSLVEGSKISAFRAICTATARAKLNEYMNGVPTLDGSGVPLYVPSGFEYTKSRYQNNVDTVVPSNSICEVDTVPANSPGRRERVATNEIVADTSSQEYTATTGKTAITPAYQGFQLYVNIRHVNPRHAISGQPVRRCPSADYQFFRSGDALEVVVTGMIRTAPSIAQGGRGGNHYGNLLDDGANPNRQLTCSISQIVKPQSFPFRYFLGSDGKVRSYQATLAFQAGAPNVYKEATVAHFRNLWINGSTTGSTFDTAGLGNIRSFVVAPDNLSVYVMRPGLLSLYTNCSDRSVTVGSYTFPGIPDCSLAATDRVDWANLDSNIDSIAVDFGMGSTDNAESASYPNDDQIYGLFNSGGNRVQLGSSSLYVGEVRTLSRTSWDSTSGYKWATSTTYNVPENRPRIQGIFMAPVIPPVAGLIASLFYFDNTCYGTMATYGDSGISTSNTTYCATIFNAADAGQTFQVRELPIQAESISL